MKILFIGNSNLVRKRIIPILSKIPDISSFTIAKYFGSYDNYGEEINKSDADIAYISSVNSDHFQSTLKALQAGMHVIIDKPATLNFKELKILTNLAKNKSLLISESTVYLYHPKLQNIKSIFESNNDKISSINAIFKFPPMNTDNFRYKKELGGGAINDLGPYAVSLGRFFYDEFPKNISIERELNKNKLDIGFTVKFLYKNNKSVIGYFGFNNEDYINFVKFKGKHVELSSNRIFTIPENEETLLNYSIQDKKYSYTFNEYSFNGSSGNSFEIFFKEVFKAIKDKNYYKFAQDMLIDGKILDNLRNF